MIYLLDANVLINANDLYYPLDRVPEFWEWLVDCGRRGVVKIPVEIYEEIKEGPSGEGSDPLFAFLADPEVRDALVLKSEVSLDCLQEVISEGYAPDLDDSEVMQVGRDPFLIAHALEFAPDRCVVTAEASKPSKKRQNRRVPDVCKDLGVRCINQHVFTRELGFSTSWKTL